MKYPCLVPERLCTTDIRISIESEEMTEDGGPVMLLDVSLKCNYQSTAKRVMTDEQKLVQISGVAMLPGDIAPDIPEITGGEAIVFGVSRRILQGMKARNPDGSVNFTKLELV